MTITPEEDHAAYYIKGRLPNGDPVTRTVGYEQIRLVTSAEDQRRNLQSTSSPTRTVRGKSYP